MCSSDLSYSVVYVVTEKLLTVFKFIEGDSRSEKCIQKFVTEFSHKILCWECGENVTTQVHT